MAVAVHLLDPAVPATPVVPAESETKETEVKEEPQNNQDAGANVSQDDLRCGSLIFTNWVFRRVNRVGRVPPHPM